MAENQDRWLELVAYEANDEVLDYVYSSLGFECESDKETYGDYGFHIEYINDIQTGSVTFLDVTYSEILVPYEESMLLYKFSWN